MNDHASKFELSLQYITFSSLGERKDFQHIVGWPLWFRQQSPTNGGLVVSNRPVAVVLDQG